MPSLTPSPQERAEIIIKRLEKEIREAKSSGRTYGRKKRKGMSYRQWQDIAREEIATAIRNAEREGVTDAWIVNRLLMVSGAALSALGFLGAVFALDRLDREIAAWATLAIGGIFLIIGTEWPLRRASKAYKAKKRARRLARIRDLDRQVKQLEKYLEAVRDDLKEEVENEMDFNT